MGIQKQKINVRDWGLLQYGKAFDRQLACVEDHVQEQGADRLVMVEHPPVITLGRSGREEHLHLPEQVLKDRGVDLYHIDRGGGATFHGPGQMVAYPIMKLENQDLHWYVATLLEAVADVLRGYGFEPEFKQGNPGIWVNNKKIASIGIAVKNWVTYHGIALNVNPDLSIFNLIVPCGNPNEVMTSMQAELNQTPDMAEVKGYFIKAFCERFGRIPNSESRHPAWLKLQAPQSSRIEKVAQTLDKLRLGTVCQSAHCPNIGECFAGGSATFMIMGRRCTRNCRFCAVENGCPQPLDIGEPARVAKAVKKLGLKYVVITSVTRDDLDDGGVAHFADTIQAIRASCPGTEVEVLVPDFKGSPSALQTVCAVRPDMFNHNIETVPGLYSIARPQASFERSLKVLEFAANRGLRVKSGMMMGLGEESLEIVETLMALRRTGCDYLTLGQYLSPSKVHVPVARYLQPHEFDRWAQKAKKMGFKEVAAGPLIRSSYKAEQMVA